MPLRSKRSSLVSSPQVPSGSFFPSSSELRLSLAYLSLWLPTVSLSLTPLCARSHSQQDMEENLPFIVFIHPPNVLFINDMKHNSLSRNCWRLYMYSRALACHWHLQLSELQRKQHWNTGELREIGAMVEKAAVVAVFSFVCNSWEQGVDSALIALTVERVVIFFLAFRKRAELKKKKPFGRNRLRQHISDQTDTNDLMTSSDN